MRQGGGGVFEPALQLFVVAVEDGKCGVQIPPPTSVVQFKFPRGELGDVRRVKKHALWVQRVEVGDEMLRRQRIVVASARVVALFDHVDELLKSVPLGARRR